MSRTIRRAVILAAACLSACSGLFQSKIAPPTIYVLAAAPPAQAPPDARVPVDLAILKPKMPAGLQMDRIAVLYPDRRLDYFADARWSGPLTEVLQDFAVREFQLHGNLRTVSGDTSVFASSYWLELEFSDFQAEYTQASAAPAVHVRLLARLGRSGDRRILGRFEADALKPAAQNRLTAIVDAYAQAADAALGEIVAAAAAVLAKNSQSP
ncbi:MAG TPA: ABC-type transport auxiliary lipoprotein family protein [Steroidobacteraceae bacterium]